MAKDIVQIIRKQYYYMCTLNDQTNVWYIQKLKRDTSGSELWLFLSFNSKNKNFFQEVEKASISEFWRAAKLLNNTFPAL